MARVIDLGGRALLDIGSYGRRGPGQRRTLQAAEIAHVVRTARGAPEVVVKVSGGATTIRGVGTHLDYIGRDGKQEIETDDGQHISELGFERQIINEWDLDLEQRKGANQRAITTRRKPPKLVHNLVFSMPKGHASREAADGSPRVCAGEVRASAQLPNDPAHRPTPAARAFGGQGGQRARHAAQHPKGNPARMAAGLRRTPPRAGRGSERDGTARARRSGTSR